MSTFDKNGNTYVFDHTVVMVHLSIDLTPSDYFCVLAINCSVNLTMYIKEILIAFLPILYLTDKYIFYSNFIQTRPIFMVCYWNNLGNYSLQNENNIYYLNMQSRCTIYYQPTIYAFTYACIHIIHWYLHIMYVLLIFNWLYCYNLIHNLNLWKYLDFDSRRPPFRDDDEQSVRTEYVDFDPSKHNPVFYGKMHEKVLADADPVLDIDPATSHPACAGFAFTEKPPASPPPPPPDAPNKDKCKYLMIWCFCVSIIYLYI